MNKTQTRITALIREGWAEMFAQLTRGIGISGTSLLSRTLPAELNYLAALPANSERAEAVLRILDRFQLQGGPNRPPANMRRFNVTLDREHAERLDQVCREKRVPRDSFIGEYVRFLVEGEDGVCEAPLRRINEVLTNPRHEYEEKRWSVSTVSVEASQKDEALSPKNPYSFLHLSEGFLEQVAEQLRNEGRPENR